MGDKYIDEFDNIDDNLMGSSLFLMYSDCDTVNASLSAITAYVNALYPDISITGGTYDQNTGIATFTNNSGGTFTVSGFLTGYTNYYTTGATLVDNVAYFDRTDALSAYTLNLSPLEFTGNTSASCITELWVSNIHGCSPITIHNSIKHNSSTVSNDTSFAFGDSVVATGSSSHAEGYLTTASGSYSHAEGSGTTASNTASHAEGRGTTAKGTYSHAEGQNTIASGTSSHTEGYLTTAKGSGSHAEGQYTTAIGDSSHAEGETTTSIGDFSHSEGYFTTARGSASHVEGNDTTAIGNRSHAEGSSTTAIGFSSHAEGYGTIASGYTSHAEGSFTLAKGNYSHAEGWLTTARGSYSHAEGSGTTANGISTHAEGGVTTATGNYSHAGGVSSIASGLGSFIHSSGSTVSGIRSVVLGGQNITGSVNDTVYVPNLNINTTPANDNTLTNVLVRASDGAVKYRTISTSTTYGLFAQTSSSTPIAATNVESSLLGSGLGTLTVPANGFSVGDSFHAVLIGHLSCVGSATLQIRIKTALGVLLADTGVMTMETTTTKHWKLDVDFTVRQLGATTVASIASGGLFAYTKNSGFNFEGVNFSVVNNTTFDTTINNTIVITAQWNTNNVGNSIFSEIFILNKIY